MCLLSINYLRYPKVEADLSDVTSDEKVMFISDYLFYEDEEGIKCFSVINNRKTGMKTTVKYIMIDNKKPKFPVTEE